ncbi:hypothetical protein [Histidinibacterium lentulum]|uniref:DUF3887 domain-containing protein n=1 Tax=Histidinibacterium lentulum TaxID=2480588 RepID=A0A3N2R9C0_9RHOB|nr:hypothetical protein [Histidinibacterium lentulum]ROU03971.1 hypothetical protein EAT49_00780 [Histidinibacterium lentulum]
MPVDATASPRAARLAAVLALCLGQSSAAEPIVPAVFADYDSYESYVVDTISVRDFAGLVVALGGGNEYSAEELVAVNAQLTRALPRDFENQSLMRAVDHGNGFREEARAFWTGKQYGYFYALLHDRGEELVVIRFEVNTSAGYIMQQF